MQNFAPLGFSVEQLSQCIEIGKSRLLWLDNLAAVLFVHLISPGEYLGERWIFTEQVFASAQRLLKTRQDPRDREPALPFFEWRVSILFREVLSALLRFVVIDAEQTPGDHHAAMRPQRVKRDFLP